MSLWRHFFKLLFAIAIMKCYIITNLYRLKGVRIMKMNKKFGISCLMLGAMVLTSCGNNGYRTYPVTGDYMTGKTAKSVYNAYLSSAPSTLNPTLSQAAENVSHLANLLDTLVMNDNYGILRKQLAKSATHTADNKQFSFEIRDKVPWVTYKGEIYKSKGVEQYVSAEDFVQTAKIILNYETQSEIYYMYTLFVNNAWEYYCYTMMQNFIKEGKAGYKEIKNDKPAQATKLAELIKEYSGHEPDEAITASDLAKIANFERVGVKVDGNKLVYTLRTSAQFFPTMLTYTPFMPTNKAFYNEMKAGYGTAVEKMLYCGPFILSEFKSNSVKYKKNEKYYRADEVHLDSVNYKVVDATTSAKDMREAFDREDVDGFSLSQKDEVGWSTYITGPEGTGTIEKPYSGVVNSRELDDVDYTYHFNLNVNRSTEEISYKNATYWAEDLENRFPTNADKENCIKNTNAALKIKEVREMILDGINFDIYNEQFDVDDIYQYQMNTFTPRGYVYDEYGKDYIEYYYEEYASKKGISLDEAKAAVKPQQASGVQFYDESDSSYQSKYPWTSLNKLRERAQSAVDQYNIMNADNKLSLPIVVDYFGAGGINADNLQIEQQLVRDWNERANGCTLSEARAQASGMPLCENSKYPYFEMVLNKISNQSVWESASQNGYFTVGAWGWIGDYADPLTYVHCYVTNGEMAKMSGNTEIFPDNYSLVDGVLVKHDKHLFKDFNDAVDAASLITTSNHERFAAFAKAEYMLLNDLKIIKPAHMYSQGWAASVSRACGYDNPSAHYGLADHSLLGIWVLTEVPSGEERAAARALQAEKKAAALEAVGNNTIEPIFD